MPISQLLIKHPYVTGIVGSLLISVFLINSNPLFNTDGVLYLRAAQAFTTGGIDAAIELYPRPFYSILIGLIHQASGLNLIHAAYLLNTLLLAGLVCAFISLAGLFSDKERIHLLAALTIIIFAGLNEHRHYIIRDFGYWAFSLAAIGCFLRHYLNLQVSFFIGWLGCTSIAALFRPEASILLLLPLCRLADLSFTDKQLGRYYSQVMMVAIILPLLLWVIDLVLQANLYVSLLDTINGELQSFRQAQPGSFAEAADRFAGQVLNRFSERYAQPALMMALMYIFFAKFFELLGLAYLIAIGTALFLSRRYQLIPRNILLPYLFAVILLTLPVLDFLANSQFLQARYTMLIVLVCMLMIPSMLDVLYEKYRNRFASGWQKWGLVLLMLYTFFDGLVSFGHSKRYLLEGVDWLQSNASAGASLYSNNAQIAYMSGLEVNWKDSRDFQYAGFVTSVNDYDYWAVKINKNDRLLQFFMRQRVTQLEKLVQFSNGRGDQLVIYKTRSVTEH